MNDFNFAIRMEIDGEKYYREQAEINKDNVLGPLCLNLAEDEKNHAKILKDKMDQLPVKLLESDTLENARTIFEGKGKLQLTKTGQHEQLEFYRAAVKNEEDSIALYQKYLKEADGFAEKEILNYLISQEKSHISIFEELISFLSGGEGHAVSPEFVNRDEYEY